MKKRILSVVLAVAMDWRVEKWKVNTMSAKR